MKYDLSAFSPKDKKLIKDNDGKSPAELMDLGLSKTGYERLLSMDAAAVNAKQQTVVEQNKSAEEQAAPKGPIKPSIVEKVNAPTTKSVENNTGQKRVRVAGGNIVNMAAAQANRFATLYPNEYQIVD